GWKAAGYDVNSGEVSHRDVTQFKGTLQQDLLASLEEVQDARENQVQLVDARPDDYFRGEAQSPDAKAPGTIPGSRNLPHSDLLNNQDKVWYLNEIAIVSQVNHAELTPEYRAVAFCNTGHWAATDWFVLSEFAGFKEVALYDGSMAEW